MHDRSFHANASRSEAARLITELAPGDLDMVFFTNGGAEATENASAWPGCTPAGTRCSPPIAAITAPPAALSSSPVTPAAGRASRACCVVKFWGPYLYRSAFHDDRGARCDRALEHLENVMMMEATNVAAVVLEPVGTNGILVPPDGYLAGVRELCDRHGIMMIADEVMAGFGRCGEWFSVNRWNVAPRSHLLRQGVNSGYVPLGGVIISRRIADTFKDRVSRRAHLLRPSARLCVGRGVDQHLQGRAGHRERPSPRRRGPRP